MGRLNVLSLLLLLLFYLLFRITSVWNTPNINFNLKCITTHLKRNASRASPGPRACIEQFALDGRSLMQCQLVSSHIVEDGVGYAQGCGGAECLEARSRWKWSPLSDVVTIFISCFVNIRYMQVTRQHVWYVNLKFILHENTLAYTFIFYNNSTYVGNSLSVHYIYIFSD